MSWKANSGRRPKAAFYTLGCKVNQQETDSLRALFELRGYESVPFQEAADVYVVNTCTVTQTSDHKSRQAISRAHARNPQAVIAVVGCYAQNKPEQVAALPGVQVIVGTQHRGSLVDLVEQAGAQRNAVEDIRKTNVFEEMPVPGNANPSARTRAQLKIQDGCDRFCSYCIIPHARGPVRSRDPEDIRRAFLQLGQRGVQEVVLTGIHLMSYGKEAAAYPALTDIIRVGAQTPGVGRIRLGSLEPAMLDDAFVRSLAALPEGKLCRQFHLSLQSGSDAVLARMRRRYTAAEYAGAARRLRAAFPGCALTTDVIAGFAGETEQEHRESLAFVEKMEFARAHVFPFSRREGTAAYQLPGQIERKEKERRAKELIAAGKTAEQNYLRAQIGTVQEVLCEEAEEGMLEGYSDTYIRVRFACDSGDAGSAVAVPGRIVPVRITGVRDGVALGMREL